MFPKGEWFSGYKKALKGLRISTQGNALGIQMSI